ncbi:MAG: hypothetical protein V1779_15640 [bacterium]
MIKYFLILIFLFSCNNTQEVNLSQVNSIAEHYVKLVLALGKFDTDYVDAYFGPEKWKSEVENWNLDIHTIIRKTDSLIKQLDKIKISDLEKEEMQRIRFLKRMIQSVYSRAEILSGKKMSFDEESKALFDIEVPSQSENNSDYILQELDKLIPGNGSLGDKFIEYRKQFIIPSEKVDTVFKTAIAEGKKRTLAHISLPSNEKFILEYVRDKSWGGYNWFKGNATSLIQINIDLPVYIDRAVGLACHEGYPGHHVYHSLIEEKFVKQNGWIEFTVYPLFSPLAVLSEGLANYGIEVAFPDSERIKFEKEVLFPLAGISNEKADEYYKILDLVGKLDYSSVNVARDYLDNKISKEEAIGKIMKAKLRAKNHAETNIRFFEQYRSYIITYYIGEELCRNWIELKIEKTKVPAKMKWKYFKEILTTPYLPSDL